MHSRNSGCFYSLRRILHCCVVKLWSQTCICTFCWARASPTGCHHPSLLFTILVLSHTGLRGDKRWKDAALNIALWFLQTVWHWSAGSMFLRPDGAVDNFGKFFGTWVTPVCQLPMEARQTPSEVLICPNGLLAQGHLFGFLL